MVTGASYLWITGAESLPSRLKLAYLPKEVSVAGGQSDGRLLNPE